MAPDTHTAPTTRDRSWIPWFILVVSALATVLGTYYISVMADTRDTIRFNAAVQRAHANARGHLDTYIALLRSGAAMLAADETITREQFRRYVRRLDIDDRYPGIQGVGLSLRVPVEGIDSLEESMRRQGMENFHVWPDTPRREYHSIVYLEPMDRRNREAIGYDMFSQTVRRRAMEQARDSGTAAMSGNVELVQEIDSIKQAGFLIYVPIYRGGDIPATVEQRRERLLGYIYSPFRAGDLLNGILGEQNYVNLNLRVFDSISTDPREMLYSSASDQDFADVEPIFRDTTELSLAGRTWQMVFAAHPEFERASSRGLVKYIAAIGTIVSLILFAVTFAQSRARERAERIAEELRRSEERLRESEGRLRRLVDSDILGIIIADMAGNVIEANDAFLDLVGFSREDLRAGRINWADLTPPEYWQEDQDAISTMRRVGSHSPFEKELVRADGSRVPVLVGTAYLGGHDDLGVGFMLDLSERRKLEEAMRHSETRFRTMIEQSPLSIQLFSLDGHCTHANQAWEEMWQAPRELLRGYNILHDRQLEERGVMPYIRRGFEGEALAIPPFRYELPSRMSPVRERWVRVFIYPVRNDRNEITEIALKVEDVTDRMRAEEELKKAKEAAEAASRSKDQFLAVLSHELRTPLTPVLTAIQLLGDDPAVDEDQQQLLEIIRRNVELEARLIDDLLDLTRIANGKLQLNRENVDAHALLRNALEIIESDREAKGLHVTLDLKAAEYSVNADPARLHQVFWNLLKNAVKFTPQGGSIAIRTSNNDGRLRLEVQDTGIGIDPQVLPKIFNAFEQGEEKITKQFGGMGLGLAISRTLVEMHGGTLTAASEGAGKGATFSMEMGTVTKTGNGAARQARSSATARTNGSARILLVEDHADTSAIMKQLLERQGYQVTAVTTVGAALDAASSVSFDLLISDIGLPDGSGLELIEQLGDRRPPRSIALSGYGMEEDIRRSREAGFAEHLTKPVNFERLHEVIRRLLEPEEQRRNG